MSALASTADPNTPDAPASRPVSRLAGRLRRLLPAAGVAAVGTAAASAQALAGPFGAVGVMAVALPLSVWLTQRQERQSRQGTDAQATAAGNDARLSAQVMPVWKRSIETAQQHAERSSEALLEAFGNVSGHLDQALSGEGASAQLDVGATDELLTRHDAQVQALLAATREAVALKNAMQAALVETAAQLQDMAAQTREVQNIGRATHLLALNASVEAMRAGAAGEGFAVVAREVRTLAGQSRQAGTQLSKTIASLRERLDDLHRQARKTDTDDDEIGRRTDQAARGLVLALIGSLADVSRASRQLRLAGREVQADLEKIFMSLQSQDRLNQMLDSVTHDIGRYVEWLHGAEDHAAERPQDWLARLEASYTMEELRSAHHGNKTIEQATSVEFF